MEYSESPVDLLLLAFKERDILTKRDDIQSAFQGSNQNDRSSRWLSEHLQYDTLLSKEEFCLYASPAAWRTETDLHRYSRLESSGDLAGIGHDPDIDVIRPLLDEDLQGAVESLHASTAVLEKQTQILTSQFQTISKQFCPQNDRRASQSGGLALLQRKYALGSQRINAVVSTLYLYCCCMLLRNHRLVTLPMSLKEA